MSKLYKINMNIDISKCTPNGGMLMQPALKVADPKQPDAVVDERGFKERTAPEVFALICGVAINGANPKVSYAQLKGFQKAKAALNNAAKEGTYVCNKTAVDILKNSLRGNQWPNQEECEAVLDAIFKAFEEAETVE